jgi:hypothetical protein
MTKKEEKKYNKAIELLIKASETIENTVGDLTPKEMKEYGLNPLWRTHDSIDNFLVKLAGL